MNNTDRTIPYKLSPAELASLRILQARTKSSSSVQAGESEGEEEEVEEINAWISDLEPINPMVEKNTS